MVWLLRHTRANGRRRTLISLLHGTMANAMPQSLGLKKAFPDRQVIALSGDGGVAMLLGDLLTAVQEKSGTRTWKQPSLPSSLIQGRHCSTSRSIERSW
jgi:thiamine pyrophosphate-dependent acetolactate synthase large subunit-like protein